MGDEVSEAFVARVAFPPARLRVPGPTQCPGDDEVLAGCRLAIAGGRAKLAPVPISRAPMFENVVAAPVSVTTPPASRLVIVPVPEARSSVPPPPLTEPTNTAPVCTARTSAAELNVTAGPALADDRAVVDQVAAFAPALALV